MMASHRPADVPAPPPPEPAPETTAPAPGAKTTLPSSSFLVGFDWILALGVLTLAFLIASFSVRNSDFWMHLATGRLFAEGKYEFGKDPFSYVGADRIWVNHAWLFDWLLYLLYKATGGPGVVVVKAIGLTLTAALLLLARKPGQTVFPGVVCVGLALVAAAPRLLLQPTAASFLFLAAFMFLLIRVPRTPGSWKFPILVAVLFCVWANTDQWFFLGPAILLLYTIGQYIRPDEGEDVGTLWKALGIGVLACMLNPYHVRVWTLPPEVVDREMAEMFKDDVEFSLLVRGGLDKEAWDFSANPVNPTALIVLLALCAIGFAVNYRRASVGLAVVWVGAMFLAVAHLRAIPFLVFVTAPIAALNLAAAGRRLIETPLSEGSVRALHTLRSGSRAAVGLIGLLMIAVSYAGWLQPFAQQRRWKWDVEPSPSLVRAAEKIQQWRETKILPPEAHLLNLQPDFANYAAWFAPSEKSFFDFRLRFHADEVADYIALRRYLAHRDPQERKRDPYDLNAFLRKHRITYAVSAHPLRHYNFWAVDALWGNEADPAAGPEWVLWHVEGRAVILGWTKQQEISTAAFDRLRFDPLRAAYVDPQLLPMPEVRQPLPPRDVWERFVIAPPVTPAEGEETLVYNQYRQTLVRRVIMRHQTLLFVADQLVLPRMLTPALSVWGSISRQLMPPVMPPEVSAVSLLAVRAARQAIKTSPDHPDGYYFLAKAYSDPTLTFPEQDMVTVATLARCRARLPENPAEVRSTNIDVLELCSDLGMAHQNAMPKRLDLLFDVTKMSIRYLEDEIEAREKNLDQFSGQLRDRAEKELDFRRKELAEREKQVKTAETDLRRSTDRYLNAVANQTSPLERARIARVLGLVKEAIDELRREHERFQKRLEGEGKDANFSDADLALQFAVHAELIELLMYDGQVEEASQILDAMDTQDAARVMASDRIRAEYHNVRHEMVDPAPHYRRLRQQIALSVGDFQTAINMQRKDLQALQRDFENFRQLNYPAGLPPLAVPNPVVQQLEGPLGLGELSVLSPLGPIAAQAGVIGRAQHVTKINFMFQLARLQVEMYSRLAQTHLEFGEIPSALSYFRQAVAMKDFADPAPQQRLAQAYIHAIEAAQGGGIPR